MGTTARTGEAVCVSIVCSLRVARELYSCERVASESVAICAAARLGRGHLACKSMGLQRRAWGMGVARRGGGHPADDTSYSFSSGGATDFNNQRRYDRQASLTVLH